MQFSVCEPVLRLLSHVQQQEMITYFETVRLIAIEGSCEVGCDWLTHIPYVTAGLLIGGRGFVLQSSDFLCVFS